MEKFNTTNPFNPNKQKQDPKKLFISVIFALIFLFIIIKCSCSEDKEDKEDKVEVKKFEKVDALVQAHVHIQTLLKSPASAEFNPLGEEGVTKVNDTTFVVVGTVDSQNSFGAMLRSNFSCKVIFHPKEDTHNIENVILE